MRKLNHSNIIKLKELLLVSEELYMVFEYLDYNLYEVYSKMKEQNRLFTEKEVKYLLVYVGIPSSRFAAGLLACIKMVSFIEI